jgi:hypothetical protein
MGVRVPQPGPRLPGGERRRTFGGVSYPSVVEEITALRARGYTADFSVTRDGQLRCDTCGHMHDPTDVVIESTARFEGASNPDDQAIVFGLRCRGCDVRGVLVTAYGPTASAEETAVITALSPPRSS